VDFEVPVDPLVPAIDEPLFGVDPLPDSLFGLVMKISLISVENTA
jgi:hypothetical protein